MGSTTEPSLAILADLSSEELRREKELQDASLVVPASCTTQSRHTALAAGTTSASGKLYLLNPLTCCQIVKTKAIFQLIFYLSVGMEPEKVLSEDQRKERFSQSISRKKVQTEHPLSLANSPPVVLSVVPSPKPTVAVSPMIASHSLSPVRSSIPGIIKETPTTEHCPTPSLPQNSENLQIQKTVFKSPSLPDRVSVIITKPRATVSVGTQFDDGDASADNAVEKIYERTIRSDTDYHLEPANLDSDDPMTHQYRINGIINENHHYNAMLESIDDTKDNHNGVKIVEIVDKVREYLISDLNGKGVFNKVVEDCQDMHNIPFHHIVNTETLNGINEEISNTTFKSKQAIGSGEEFLESQTILKYIHKKFDQIDLKRKRSLEETLEKDVATKRINLMAEKG